VCITGHKSSSSIVLKQKQREFMDEWADLLFAEIKISNYQNSVIRE
jgi:hypothetical protein